jgi:hypothetical protein
MKEICIPIPGFEDDQIAEVTLTVGDKKLSYSYRIESFPWKLDSNLSITDDFTDHEHASFEQIMMLRGALATYDKGWELIQIFTPRKGATHIQVLYRKRNGN